MTKNDRRGGWKGWVRLAGAAAVLALGVLTQPKVAVALPECAAFVSGGPNYPAYGELVGSMTVEECAIVQGGIPGTGATYERCITYEVGYYLFSDAYRQLDCRNYSLWNDR